VVKPLAPIPFPVFDDLRHQVLDWANGRTETAVREMKRVQTRLERVKGSQRHQKLAEFLSYAAMAAEAGETEGTRYILLTAMATLGWPLVEGIEMPGAVGPGAVEVDTGVSVRTRTS
jgi:hypothetical protein